ncbi:MAG TPA: hypothetical protein VK507_08175 [Iamia sp.]|nr:hypothetical protein [Iamia sp.]
MNKLDEVGEADGWRCWLCDEAVDPDMSVNDPRGPSIDLRTTKSKAKAKAKKGREATERLAHRGCNTGKGAVAPVVPWPDDLFVVDPAPLIAVVDRLQRKGGREAVARCMTRDDADALATWLVERIGRLEPDLAVTTRVDEGGGQQVVSLLA